MSRLVEEKMKYKRLVVKIGTSSLTRVGGIHLQHMDKLARILSDLRATGLEIMLVSSGAISIGCQKLQLETRPSEVRMQQAVAAVGQCEMMHLYDKLFGEYCQNVGQVLLTEDDVGDEVRSANLASTISALLEMNVIPIINENDSVSHAEIQAEHTRVFGDNDTLSAIVAQLVDADLLVIFSDIDGLFDKNPHDYPDAQLIDVVHAVTPEIRQKAGGKSLWGTGGMQTKLDAAERCLDHGIDMYVLNSARMDELYHALAGEPTHGTRFSPA